MTLTHDMTFLDTLMHLFKYSNIQIFQIFKYYQHVRNAGLDVQSLFQFGVKEGK